MDSEVRRNRGEGRMAKYVGSREEILRSIHDFSDSDEQELLKYFENVGFPEKD